MFLGYDSPVIWTSNPLFRRQQTRADQPQSHPRGVTTPAHTLATPTITTSQDMTSPHHQTSLPSPHTPGVDVSMSTQNSALSQASGSPNTARAKGEFTRGNRKLDSETENIMEAVSDDGKFNFGLYPGVYDTCTLYLVWFVMLFLLIFEYLCFFDSLF